MNTGPGHSAHGPSSLPNWWPADPRHTSTSTSDVMSQLCRVCGEPAAGFHFGAFTCEGCKSFFGRTYNNLGSISECKNNGECVINKKNRTSCKACRLRKCLVVGMSKSGSRYGRRSNWFKIHCLLQEQQQQQQQHHHQQHHPLQNPLPNALQNPLQNPQFQSAGLAAGLQHFQHHLHQRSLHAAGRPSARDAAGPTPPPPWADVKHHLRLDADNNNSVAGDLNDKPDAPGGRLSAAAAVVQAVRPELLRWPSPFFPAFPFPPPAPFFLALQPPPQPQPPPPPQQVARSSGSPASRSSSRSAVEEEDDDDGGGGGGRGEDDGQPAPKRAAVGRELPPVQDSPMDLSVSAAVPPPPSSSPRPSPSSPSSSSSPSSPSSSRSSSRSASPSDGGGADDHRPSAAADHHRHHRRHHQRRRRRRWRRAEDAADGRTGGGGSESDGDGSGPRRRGDGRPAKNVPLDLTCDRS